MIRFEKCANLIVDSKLNDKVNSVSPLYTQKYFSPENLFQNLEGGTNQKVEIVGKNLFGGLNEVQGLGILDDRDSYIEKTHSRLNSSQNSVNVSFPLKGPTNTKASNLPIFKLLQAFRLQQYSKTFSDLGYGYEVYKVALMLPRQRHDLLNKLNLMPGHRARFISLFEIIDQIYPREEKFKMMQNFKKGNKPSVLTASNFNPKNQAEPLDGNSNTSKKKRSLIRCYTSLDKQAKKDINEKFIRKIKENKPNSYQKNGGMLQNVINKHVSKSNTRKAIKSIFPPSMYDKYGDSGSSKSRSTSKNQREFSDKRDRKVQNVVKRNRLPPLPEVNGGGKTGHGYIAKSRRSENIDMRRASTGLSKAKNGVSSQGKYSRSGSQKKEDLQINAMSATKHPAYESYTKSFHSGSAKRDSSNQKYEKSRKPKSLNREVSAGAKRRKQRNVAYRSNGNKSKSKSGSKKRSKNKSRDGVLSTSAASNAGRLISSASTSDKRSMKNYPNNSCIHNQKLTKIEEKPRRLDKIRKPPMEKPFNKGGIKSTSSTTSKPKSNHVVKSHRVEIPKNQSNNVSKAGTSFKNDSSEKDQSIDIKKFGSIF